MTRTLVTVSVEGEGRFTAYRGASLLDAALMNGFDLPHDCRAGVCGTCQVRVVTGSVSGGETANDHCVLACQARIETDLAIAVEDVPPVERLSGRVAAVTQLASDVVEVAIATSRPWTFLPGQYAQFRFSGFPARCFSPTFPLGGAAGRDEVRLHVRRVPGGRVSSALGQAIAPGHKVGITGPHGSAYFRPGSSRPLILVATGTGFAPVWAIAHAALCETPDRPIMVIAGARTLASLYFGQALLRLAAFPKVQVLPVLATAHASVGFNVGSPADFLPPLSSDDCIYVCGAPAMVEEVQRQAKAVGAACFADAFTPAAPEPGKLLFRARRQPSCPQVQTS